MNIPPGYRFNPSDQLLIKDYLFKKAMGMLSLPFDFILEKNLYGQNAEPWNVFNNLDYLWDISCSGPKESNTYVKKSTHVFTKLSKVNGKKRIATMAGYGSWHGETAGKKIYDRCTEEEICSMKMFTFRHNKAVSGDDHWIMYEYSLSGVSSACGLKYEDCVICKITRCLSKKNYDREEKQRFSDMHVNNIRKDYLLSGTKRAREEEVIGLEDEGNRDCSECDEMFAAELEENLFSAELESPFDSVIRPDDEKFAAELEQNLLADELEDDETFAAEYEQNLIAAKSESPSNSLIRPDDEKFAAELEQNLLAAELDDDETFAAELEENLMAADMEHGFTLKNLDEGLLGMKFASFGELLQPMCSSHELSQIGTWMALLGV